MNWTVYILHASQFTVRFLIKCLFREGPKVRTMYRRPSELGMSTTPMEDKSEVRR